MAITKKIRFEVFKRDGFACAYCGKTPPAVTLEVDHIEPVSKGGKDEIANLITACFDCNRGKKDIPLEKIPNKLLENLEVLQEQEDQLKAYRKLVKKVQVRIEADIDEVRSVYTDYYGWKLNGIPEAESIKRFLQHLPKHEVIDAMGRVIVKFPNPIYRDAPDLFRYFCGICWRKIKSPGEGH